MPSLSHTPEQDATIRKCWPDLSVTVEQIGRMLGKSKGAIVGRAHRIGLGSRQKRPLSEKPKAVEKRRERRSRTMAGPRQFHPAFGKRGACQWLNKDGKHWDCCGEPAQENTSWCAEHRARVFMKRKV